MTLRPLLLRDASSGSGLTAARVEDPRLSGNPDSGDAHTNVLREIFESARRRERAMPRCAGCATHPVHAGLGTCLGMPFGTKDGICRCPFVNGEPVEEGTR